MTQTTRRMFLASTAAALPAAAANFTRPIGVQLYTVRSVYPKAEHATIEAIAKIGYKEVETLRMSLDSSLPLLKQFGLKPVSGHYETCFVTGNWEAWKGAFPQGKPAGIDWKSLCGTAAKAGQKYMVIPYVQPGERGKNLDFYKTFAEQLNKAGAETKAAGMQLAYHHHAFEFGALDSADDGRPVPARESRKRFEQRLGDQVASVARGRHRVRRPRMDRHGHVGRDRPRGGRPDDRPPIVAAVENVVRVGLQAKPNVNRR